MAGPALRQSARRRCYPGSVPWVPHLTLQRNWPVLGRARGPLCQTALRPTPALHRTGGGRPDNELTRTDGGGKPKRGEATTSSRRDSPPRHSPPRGGFRAVLLVPTFIRIPRIYVYTYIRWPKSRIYVASGHVYTCIRIYVGTFYVYTSSIPRYV